MNIRVGSWVCELKRETSVGDDAPNDTAGTGEFLIVARRCAAGLRSDKIPDAVARPSLVGDKTTAIPPIAVSASMIDAEERTFGVVGGRLAFNQVHVEPNGIIASSRKIGVVDIDRAGEAGVTSLLQVR